MANQEQVEELGTFIRDTIKQYEMPSLLPGVVRSYGATEHDIARAILNDDRWERRNG